MKQRHTLLGVIAGVALLAATTLNAQPIQFFGQDASPGGTVPAGGNAETARNAFLSNLSSGVGTEDFESFATGDTSPFSLTFPGSTGSIGANLVGANSIVRGSAGSGRFATSGSKYLELGYSGTFDITFTSAVAAFGFYGTDIGDFSGDLVLTLANGGTTSITLDTSGSANGNLLFFGFIDQTNSYTGIQFSNTSGSDIFGFDDMTIGDLAQVQVPDGGASVALLGMALGALGFIRRRFIA